MSKQKESQAEKYERWRKKYAEYIQIFVEDFKFVEINIGKNKKVFNFEYFDKRLIEYSFYVIINEHSCTLAIHSDYEKQIKKHSYFSEFIFVGVFHSGLLGFRQDVDEKRKFEERRKEYNFEREFTSVDAQKHHLKNQSIIAKENNRNNSNDNKVGLGFGFENSEELKVFLEFILQALVGNTDINRKYHHNELDCEQEIYCEQELKNNPKYNFLSDVEKEILISARRKQGMFRISIIKEFGGSCFVTGCDNENFLIASHIKSWSDCIKDGLKTNHFRDAIDPHNGLLLIPNLDKAFDKHLISFDDDGKIIISKTLKNNPNLMNILGIHQDMKLRIALNKEQKTFLAYHRDQFFKEEEKR